MTRRLVSLLCLSLAACAHTAHSQTQPEGVTAAGPVATLAPAPDLTERGRAIVALYYGTDAAAFREQISPSIRSQVTVEQIKSANEGLKAKIGGEKAMVSEKMTTFNGAPVYQRTFTSTVVPDTLDFNVVFDAQGLVLAYTIRPHGDPVMPSGK